MNKNEQELYQSPQVDVIEIKAHRVMCASNGGLQQYDDGTWTW